jgi:DNA mismatch repair protein MutL
MVLAPHTIKIVSYEVETKSASMTFQSLIQVLDEKTINQIAAGEVIESPGCLIKELVENAIDSGATFISVESHGAGRGSLIVRDDGRGMSEGDLPLSIERHATSKLRHIDDLYALHTLGFRGEALSSIAAVSRLKIHSAKEKEIGAVLAVEGGKQVSLTPLPRKQGTTVEVSSLFYNVPARKKFQKSKAADVAEIHRVLVAAALSYPTIGFEWLSEGKKQFCIHASQTLLERIEILLGTEFAKNCLEFKEEGLFGFIGKPSCHKPTRQSQYLFINHRAVVSPFISKIIQEAYGQRLPERRFPLFVLHLHIAPGEIDVNIHPRKTEVKLSQEEEIKKQVQKAVKRALEEAYKPPQRVQLPTLMPTSVAFFSKPAPPVAPPIEDILFESFFLFGPYAVVKKEEEILFVDLTRARQRLFFEQAAVKKKSAIQSLLIPRVIEKTPLECRMLEKNSVFLSDLGIAIRPFGVNAFCIDAVPENLSEAEVDAMIEASLHEESSAQKMSACIGARTLKMHEAESFLKALFRCKNSATCPQGKPIFFRATEKEIAKWIA